MPSEKKICIQNSKYTSSSGNTDEKQFTENTKEDKRKNLIVLRV